jgi:hypothetical protein
MAKLWHEFLGEFGLGVISPEPQAKLQEYWLLFRVVPK